MIKSNKINFQDKFFIAGSSGMVGSAVCRILKKNGYGNKKLGGEIFTPKRNNLDLMNENEVKLWFKKNKPSVVVIAAARVGGILANSTMPYNFLIEKSEDTK